MYVHRKYMYLHSHPSVTTWSALYPRNVTSSIVCVLHWEQPVPPGDALITIVYRLIWRTNSSLCESVYIGTNDRRAGKQRQKVIQTHKLIHCMYVVQVFMHKGFDFQDIRKYIVKPYSYWVKNVWDFHIQRNCAYLERLFVR